MIYEFQCQKCEDQTDRQVRMVKRNDPLPCERSDCDGEAVYRFNPENTSFVLKGFGWPTRDAKTTKSMKAKQFAAKKKARDNVLRPTLQPNFAGQDTESWADARDAAHQFNVKEKPEVPLDTTSYDKFVENERLSKSKSKSKATTVAVPASTA